MRRAWIPPIVIAALLALALVLAVPPAGAQNIVDYDDDDDGLIDITTPAQLNAVRHDLNGNGDATHNDYVTAFPDRDANSATRMGCPSGTCTGYELRDNLDLSSYTNWAPIGGSYTATFEGNGHTISGFTMSTGNDDAGLFGHLSNSGRIYRVGVVNASVTGTSSNSQELGILVGESHGIIRMSYTTGAVTAGSGTWHKTGGLVGHNRDRGHIYASYSTATVTGSSGNFALAGGLVGMTGEAQSGQHGDITASYASGAVSGVGHVGGLTGRLIGGTISYSYSFGRVTGSGANIGGLIGQRDNNPAVFTNNNYYDRERSGRSDTGRGVPKTTRELQTPAEYAGTIFANWNVDVTGDGEADDPWDFGTRRNYPLLRVDFNRDGRATCLEFGRQPCYREPSPPPYNPAHDHPEIYANARYEMAVSCAVQTTGTGDDAITTSTITFDLGAYTRPITLALSLWDGDVFRSLQSQNIAMPELRQEGQTATVEVVTDPAQTRFRLDSEYGLNLVLGYADCHTDDP